MGKEFACAFSVELSVWGRVLRFRCKPAGEGINHCVPDEKLWHDLDVTCLGFPML